MPSISRSYRRVCLAALSLFAVTLAGLGLVSRSAPARAASIGQLQDEIGAGQGLVSNLAGQVSADSGRLAQLHESISALEGQITRLQADLDAKHQKLIKLRSQLHAARRRLRQLEHFEKHAETVLSSQLVNSYEADRPDIVSVVLSSTGFQDLLERLSFAQRIQRQDVSVIEQVRAARRAVATQATRLGALELRQERLTEQVLGQRNRLAQSKVSLVREQISVASARDAQAGKLAGARGHVAHLQSQLSRLQAAQASAAAQAAATSPRAAAAAVSPGQVSSAGGFTFPLPKDAVVGPGSWTPDDGVDMAAPGGTPEFAVCSGTIVLHGIGGFGPWAPVLHCDSPIDGYDYVYYGHAGPANQLPVGTHVSAGEVMSSIGPGIVGISTGPHIELGFCDSSGTPIGPSSAGTMMSLLQAAY